MSWRNHAQGPKHPHFRYPNTWHGRVNPGRLGSCDRRSGQCHQRGRGRAHALNSFLRLTQPGTWRSACYRFGESAAGRSHFCPSRRELTEPVPEGYPAHRDRRPCVTLGALLFHSPSRHIALQQSHQACHAIARSAPGRRCGHVVVPGARISGWRNPRPWPDSASTPAAHASSTAGL
jgi:hypothetical protein